MKHKQKSERISFRSGGSIFKLLISGLGLACWSSLLTTIMLPYQIFRVFMPERKPGRPGSHPLSRMFTKAFENKKAKKFVGVGLTVIIMLFGVMGNILATNETEIADPILIMAPNSQVMTEVTLSKPIEGMLTQGFNGLHRGIDVLAPIGTEIRPITKGRVVDASYGRIGWGNTVVIEHKKGLRSRYAHLRDIKAVEGEVIENNFVLGTVGMTGWTTGPHLHLEIYQDGKAIDPKTVLPEFPAKSNNLAQGK